MGLPVDEIGGRRPGGGGMDRPRGAGAAAGAPGGVPTGGAAGRAGAGAGAVAEAAAGRRTSASSTTGRGGGCSLPLEVKTRRGGVAAGAGAAGAAGAAGEAATGTTAGAGAGSVRSGTATSGAAGSGSVGTSVTVVTATAGSGAAGAASGSASGAALAALAVLALGLAAFFSGSGGCSSRTRPSRSALRRTRSAWASTTLEECDLTPIPSDSQRSSVSLLVSPSSRASSYTRMFPAKSGSQFLLAIRPGTAIARQGASMVWVGVSQRPARAKPRALYPRTPQPARRSEMVGLRVGRRGLGGRVVARHPYRSGLRGGSGC